MAENINALILPIGADVSQFEKSIKDVKDAYKSLKQEIDKTPFNLVTSQQINQLKGLENTIEQLQNRVNKTNFNQLNNSSKDARTALTSLSLVTQDLPFGFIGIQNNLPGLIQSFGELQRTSGGTKGALAQIGAALTGPAGLFLGFSAVTAAVTFAIQKYGSLGEAIKVLFGAAKPLTEAQKEFNKAIFETTGRLTVEDAKVSALTKTLLNQKVPQKDRLAAYNELTKIAPDVVAGISKENALTSESNLLIETNAKTRKELTRLKIQEAGITAALTTNETKLAELRNKLIIADQDYVKAVSELNKANKQAIITGFGSQTQQQIALKTLNDNIVAVQQLRTQIDGLTREQQGYLDQLDPTANGIAKINAETDARIKKLKDEEKAQKDAAKALKKEGIGNIVEGEIGNGVITSNLDFLRRTIEANVRLTNASVDKMVRYRDSKLKQPSPLDLAPDKLSKIPAMPMSKELELQIGQTKLMLEETAQNFATAKEALSDVFFNPLTDLFTNFMDTGKMAFKEFGKAILSTIKQLVAKIIATGIINLLASFLVPGGAQATSLLSGVAGAGGSRLGQAFGGAVRSVLGIRNNIANPTFAGIGGGGMQMNGQVVFVQRGSDLVGVLNRTNGTINRVG